MRMSMNSNTTLAKYDLKHNNISEDGMTELCTILGESKHVSMVTLSEWISSDMMTMLQEALAANKPAKGKKGKGKKKK